MSTRDAYHIWPPISDDLISNETPLRLESSRQRAESVRKRPGPFAKTTPPRQLIASRLPGAVTLRLTCDFAPSAPAHFGSLSIRFQLRLRLRDLDLELDSIWRPNLHSGSPDSHDQRAPAKVRSHVDTEQRRPMREVILSDIFDARYSSLRAEGRPRVTSERATFSEGALFLEARLSAPRSGQIGSRARV